MSHGAVLAALALLFTTTATEDRGDGSGRKPLCISVVTGVEEQSGHSCREDDGSAYLRRVVLSSCALADARLERTWWRDGAETIQYNYTGWAGNTRGATINWRTEAVGPCS